MLIGLPPRVLLARDPIDFRKSIDGLAAVCDVVLGEDALDGTLFLFVNRRRNAVKGLVWTPGGFVMLYKRLERGRFRWPTFDTDRATMTHAEMTAMMEGFDLSRARRLPRWKPQQRGARTDPTGYKGP